MNWPMVKMSISKSHDIKFVTVSQTGGIEAQLLFSNNYLVQINADSIPIFDLNLR